MKQASTLFRIIRPVATPSVVFALLAASAATSALAFAVPLTVLQAYDRILSYGSVSTLNFLALGCLAALALNALIEWGQSALSAWASARFVRIRDRELIDRILEADPEVVAREGSEKHLERLRTLSATANTLIGRTMPIAAEAPFALAYAAVLVYIGGPAAIAAASAAAVELLLALFARSPVLAAACRAEEAERDRVSYIAYALERIHFIKAQALEHVVLSGFERKQSAELYASERKMAINRRMDEADRIIMAASTFGTILWGGILVARGKLTVGSVSACLFFATRLVGLARDVRRATFAVTDAAADSAELARGLALPVFPGAREPPLPRTVEGRLEFEKVQYSDTATGAPLLTDLSFIVRPGEAAAVSAPGLSGAARERASSICRLAAGLIAPEAGQVCVDAFPSGKWNFRGRGGAVSYVSSRSGVLPGTILENIARFEPAFLDGALDMAQLLGLDAIVSRLPRGFETAIGPKNPGGLSASSIRLVTVARALSLRPRLFIWDEADADLDGESRERILDLLGELRGATTLLINSTDSAFCALASGRILGETAA